MPKSLWGARIRNLREQRGLSCRALGARMQPPMSDSQVAKYEKGDYTIDEPKAHRFAKALGVKPHEIIVDDPAARRLLGAVEGLDESAEALLVQLAEEWRRASGKSR